MKPLRLGVVVQRYGSGVDGGAELHCRWVAGHLARRHRVTVLTTTARDYRTWEEHFPAGEEQDGPVRVLRFQVEDRRDPDFDQRTAEILAGPAEPEAQEDWLRQQGPVSPGLIRHLEEARDQYDALLVYTYLYHPAVAAARAWTGPLVLVPTAHDEPVAHLEIFQGLYRRADGLVFLTPEEERFVRLTYPVTGTPSRVAGVGIELAPGPAPEEVASIHGLEAPYLLYMGRIEEGKGCLELLEHHARYRREGGRVDLILAGRLHLELPEEPTVRYLGFIPEEQKAGLFGGAAVVAAPSSFESLSILALEGMACGRPVLANARSAVLRGHCLRGGGGLYYQDAREFCACLDRLLTEPELAAALGRSGRQYVERDYRWETVLDRIEAVLDLIPG